MYQTPEIETVDILGIGFGPSNIALAIAHEELGSDQSILFLEAADGPCWQPEMLLDGSDIQNNPLRDLVTPRNPRSHYTFTNFLKHKGRLFEYLNLGLHYPLRKEYAQYVQWVADHFAGCVRYSTPALSITMDAVQGLWHVQTKTGLIAARALVVGTGRSRNIPPFASDALGPRVFHLCDYNARIKALGDGIKSIAVIGASQSAVEINLDLIARFPQAEIHAVHRSFAMRQKDTSPFSDYVYFPEFIDYFFKIDDAGRESLQSQLRGTNYSAADMDVLHTLIVKIYEERLDGRNRIHIHNNTEIDGLAVTAQGVAVQLQERFLHEKRTLSVDAVVLATGFRDLGTGPADELFPPLLRDVAHRLARRADNALAVMRDYRVMCDNGAPLYLNGLCESSHGLGDAGSFSLLSIRSADIIESLKQSLTEARNLPTTPPQEAALQLVD